VKQTSIVLKCDSCPGGTVTVLAFADPLWPGLVVNRMHAHRTHDNGVMSEDELPAWIVTHAKSGVGIPAGFESREAAEYALGLLGDIPGADWTRPFGELQAPDFQLAMRGALQQAQALRTGIPEGRVDGGNVQ
jgi:hypothetical protein